MSEKSLAKVCKRCSVEKPLTEFHKQPSGPMGRHSWCKVCANAYAKVMRVKVTTPENKFRWGLKTRYGITPETLAMMRSQQGGLCAICGGVMLHERIDHDHQTGRVRGLLCHRCNLLLAGLEDADFMRRALAYLSSTADSHANHSQSPGSA